MATTPSPSGRAGDGETGAEPTAEIKGKNEGDVGNATDLATSSSTSEVNTGESSVSKGGSHDQKTPQRLKLSKLTNPLPLQKSSRRSKMKRQRKIQHTLSLPPSKHRNWYRKPKSE